MIELYADLFIGSDDDVDAFLDKYPDGCIVHAAKEPWHRTALGYTQQAAPKQHPNYLAKVTDKRMYMNLVDSPDVKYIPAELVDRALGVVLAWYYDGEGILIHCNKGESRSVMLGHCLEKFLGVPLVELAAPKGHGCYQYCINNFGRYIQMARNGELPR